MAVVSDQATAVGVTAVPTPTTELGSDLFFIHQMCMTNIAFLSAIGIQMPGSRVYEINSKAMRKVNNDSDIILVAEADATQEGVIFDIMGRMLIKEH